MKICKKKKEKEIFVTRWVLIVVSILHNELFNNINFLETSSLIIQNFALSNYFFYPL